MLLMRQIHGKFQRSALAGLVLLGLAACGSADALNLFVSSDEPGSLPCPSVSVLANAERLTIFRPGGGQDLIDIDTEARIDDFYANCVYDVDPDTGYGSIEVELSLGITASRGPANSSKIADLPYFVTVTTVDKQLLNKGNFVIPIGFEGNRYKVSVFDDPVIMTIPIEPPKTGYDFRIYLGFQLTPEQLEYNLTAPLSRG